jgi:hypothetical protein
MGDVMTKVKHQKKLSDQAARKAWDAGDTFIVVKSDELPKGALINTDTYLAAVVYDPENCGFGTYLRGL